VAPDEPAHPDDLVSTMDSDFGVLDYVRPPGSLDGYVPGWAAPPHRPGADVASWI
jgi:hypothetical protein